MTLPVFVAKAFGGGCQANDLAVLMGSSDTSFTLASTPSTWLDVNGNPLGSAGNFVVVLDRGQSTEEKVLCTGYTGAVVSVYNSGGYTGRGYDGTTAQIHAVPAADNGLVQPVWSGRDAYEANLAVANTIGQIAAAGDILYGTAAHTMDNLAIGTAGQYLTVAPGGTTLQWSSTPSTDSGWLALSSYLASYVTSSITPQYRKINTVVRLEGAVALGGSFIGPTLFTLPAGYRPTATRGFTLATNDADVVWTCTVNASGVCTINAAATPGYNVYLDSISFTTD